MLNKIRRNADVVVIYGGVIFQIQGQTSQHFLNEDVFVDLVSRCLSSIQNSVEEIQLREPLILCLGILDKFVTKLITCLSEEISDGDDCCCCSRLISIIIGRRGRIRNELIVELHKTTQRRKYTSIINSVTCCGVEVIEQGLDDCSEERFGLNR